MPMEPEDVFARINLKNARKRKEGVIADLEKLVVVLPVVIKFLKMPVISLKEYLELVQILTEMDDKMYKATEKVIRNIKYVKAEEELEVLRKEQNDGLVD